MKSGVSPLEQDRNLVEAVTNPEVDNRRPMSKELEALGMQRSKMREKTM